VGFPFVDWVTATGSEATREVAKIENRRSRASARIAKVANLELALSRLVAFLAQPVRDDRDQAGVIQACQAAIRAFQQARTG
jgi:hypothetical protein